jgi:nicotinamidase-related amidase
MPRERCVHALKASPSACKANPRMARSVRQIMAPRRQTTHTSDLALLLVDVINHFEFPRGDRLLKNAMSTAKKLAGLKTRARRAGVATIYVNDNFGQWRSDARKVLEYCLRPDAPGRDFVEAIRPDKDDYLVLKPMHSSFYQTPLDTLLAHLKVSRIILTGLATNSCIVCTAHDAMMRNIPFYVVSDCCAAPSQREHAQAIEHLSAITGAKVVTSSSIRFK